MGIKDIFNNFSGEDGKITKKEVTRNKITDIMEELNINVFLNRARKKSGDSIVTVKGPRGGKHQVYTLKDSKIIKLPGDYKAYALSLKQLINKLNGEYPSTIKSSDGTEVTLNEYTNKVDITERKIKEIKDLPTEIIKELGLEIDPETNKVSLKESKILSEKQDGYVGFITKIEKKVEKVVDLVADEKFSKLSDKFKKAVPKGTHFVYLTNRGGNIEDSFIKCFGAYILGTACEIVDGERKNLITGTLEDIQNFKVEDENIIYAEINVGDDIFGMNSISANIDSSEDISSENKENSFGQQLIEVFEGIYKKKEDTLNELIDKGVFTFFPLEGEAEKALTREEAESYDGKLILQIDISKVENDKVNKGKIEKLKVKIEELKEKFNKSV